MPAHRCIADLPDQSPEWLWPGRVPRGALTLLVGDSGRGKSLLTLDMAARVTAGLPWPDGPPPNEPGDVLLLSAEDSIARTVRARLAALGADLRRVHYLNAGLWNHDADVMQRRPEVQSVFMSTTFGEIPGHAYHALRRDAHNLKATVESLPDCRLVVLDPVPAYLHAIDADDLEGARTYLAPLITLADRTGVAIVAVAHRDQSMRSPTSGAGARRQNPLRALAAMARAIHLVECVPEPSADAARRRVFAPMKNNLAEPLPPLGFTIATGPEGAAIIQWSTERLTFTADELFATTSPQHEPPRRVPEITRAVAWLQGALAAGPVPTRELVARAAADGINERCLERARARLGVVSTNDNKIGGHWVCALPRTDPFCRGRQVSEVAALAVSADSRSPDQIATDSPRCTINAERP